MGRYGPPSVDTYHAWDLSWAMSCVPRVPLGSLPVHVLSPIPTSLHAPCTQAQCVFVRNARRLIVDLGWVL